VSPHQKFFSKDAVAFIVHDAILAISRDLHSGKESIDSLYYEINTSPQLNDDNKVILKNFIAVVFGLE
jgi:hypothetical protein